MNFIENIKERAKQNIKKIILPETMDKRILTAAMICEKEHIAKIILIGDSLKTNALANENNIDINGIEIINPETSNMTNDLINDLYELRKEKGMTIEEATRLIHEDYMYFACMLVYKGYADGIVSGACHSTSNTLRPSLQIIKASKEYPLVSSFFLMDVPNCQYGLDGIFVFGDCGLEQNPDSTKLAAIAKESAESFELLTKKEPLVALLSHSTKGSAKHDDVTKVTEALKIAQETYPGLKIDGELQLDAAIVPEVAELKAPDSKIAGHANVLIFPDLDAGNIGYKLVERLAHAQVYGPITQGMKKPVNDLSRGCNVESIVGVIAITSVQCK